MIVDGATGIVWREKRKAVATLVVERVKSMTKGQEGQLAIVAVGGKRGTESISKLCDDDGIELAILTESRSHTRARHSREAGRPARQVTGFLDYHCLSRDIHGVVKSVQQRQRGRGAQVSLHAHE